MASENLGMSTVRAANQAVTNKNKTSKVTIQEIEINNYKRYLALRSTVCQYR